ncbi:hypothetical protein SpCBS45565_g03386 [Spizellomyces sp. 'palustris']|nr:hypothetical protein SpCBS45565_g03386 [Spizellomyces sp. 'palustris']
MTPFFPSGSIEHDNDEPPSRRRTRFASDSFSMPRPPSDLLWENGAYDEEVSGILREDDGEKRVSFAPTLASLPVVEEVDDANTADQEVTDSEASSDSEPDERTPVLPTFIRRPRPPLRSATTVEVDSSRRNTWHPFTLPRIASGPRSATSRRSIWGYGSISTESTDDEAPSRRPSRARAQWRKSFIFSKRKSAVYDDEGPDNIMGTGMRVWYEDYTTIDWIHDTVKERVRLRSLRSIPGLKGRLMNHLDAAQAWILLALIGIACGCIASFIDIAYNFLSDLRTGYCGTDVWRNRRSCCAASSSEICTSWVTWPDHFNLHPISPFTHYTSYIMYTVTGICLATSSALVVKLSKAASIPSSSGETSSSEPSWVTTARAQRGLRRSRSRDHSMKQQKKMKYHAAGSGIPEVKTILGGFVIRGFLGFRTLVVKVFALILSISSGLVIGAQGPLVHISCAVGNVLSRMFNKYAKNEGKRREILSAASAAGVSVAFGAPLGGVLFALEEVSYYFPLKTMWRSFFCALCAAGTVRLINPLGSGKVVLFQVEWEGDTQLGGVWRLWEIIPFAVVGILGGVYGAMFIRLTAAWSRIRARSWFGRRHVLEVFIIAVITGAVSFLWDLTRMGNGELVGELFAQCTSSTVNSPLCRTKSISSTLEILAITLAVKVMLTVITFGVKVPAGIFIPSMCVGALMGRMVGVSVEWMVGTYPDNWMFESCRGANLGVLGGQSCVVPGVYAVVGAAAAVSGVTRMTVSLTVIILELTGSLPSLLPAMFSIMLAKWVGDAIAPMGLYETAIFDSGYPYLDAKRGVRARGGKGWTVVDVMEAGKKRGKSIAVIRCGTKYTIDDLECLAKGTANVGARSGRSTVNNGQQEDSGFPVVEGSDVLVGYIATPELLHAVHLVRTSPNPTWPVVFRRPPPVASVTERDKMMSQVERIVDLEGLLNAVASSSGPGGRGRSPVGRGGWRSTTPEHSIERGSAQSLMSPSSPPTQAPLHHFPYTSATTASLTPRIPPEPISPESTDTESEVHDFTPWMDTAPLSVPHTTSLDLVHELFVKLGIKTLCVVCDGKLVGVVHKKGVVAFVREVSERSGEGD